MTWMADDLSVVSQCAHMHGRGTKQTKRCNQLQRRTNAVFKSDNLVPIVPIVTHPSLPGIPHRIIKAAVGWEKTTLF